MISKILIVFGLLAFVLLVPGCGGSSLYRLADELPAGAPKGFVEFYWTQSDYEGRKEIWLGTTILVSEHTGGTTRSWGSLTGSLLTAPSLREQVMWRLRIATPPGEHFFTVTAGFGGPTFESYPDPLLGNVSAYIGDSEAVSIPMDIRVSVREGMTSFVRVKTLGNCEDIKDVDAAFRHQRPFSVSQRKCWVLAGTGKVAMIAAFPSANSASSLARSLKEDDWTLRWHAARESAGNGDAKVVQGLLAALKDDAPWVRIEAAHSLAATNDPTLRGTLVLAMIEELGRTRYPIARAAAADLLGELGDRKALDPLRKFLNEIEAEGKLIPRRGGGVGWGDHAAAAQHAKEAIKRINAVK